MPIAEVVFSVLLQFCNFFFQFSANYDCATFSEAVCISWEGVALSIKSHVAVQTGGTVPSAQLHPKLGGSPY